MEERVPEAQGGGEGDREEGGCGVKGRAGGSEAVFYEAKFVKLASVENTVARRLMFGCAGSPAQARWPSVQ